MSLRASSIVIGVLAVAVVALVVFSVLRISDLNSQVDDLETKVSDLDDATSVLREASAEDVEAGIGKIISRLRKIEECLPELQTEVTSMSLERVGEEYYVSPDAQVSSYCSPIVYGDGFGE
jgi:hypothetical protein